MKMVSVKRFFLISWDKAKSDITVMKLPDLPIALTNAAATYNGDLVYIEEVKQETLYLISFFVSI